MKRRTLTMDPDVAKLDGEWLIIDEHGKAPKRVRVKLQLWSAAHLVERLAHYARIKRQLALNALAQMKTEVDK